MGRELLPDWDGWPRTAAETLALAGAGKSQSYELLGRLRDTLPSLLGTPGRPTSPPADPNVEGAVLHAVCDYLMAHPGAAYGTGERRTYTDDFRRFVVGLTAPGQPGEGGSGAELAHAAGVPLGTLKDWLRLPASPRPHDIPAPPPEPASHAKSAKNPASDPTASISECVRSAHLRQILALWPSWTGPFQAFCQMLRTEHRLPHGDTFIANALQSAGLRHRKPRQPVEAPWSHHTFSLLFPGAQWLGDGTSIVVRWNQQIFVFNVEALLDPAADALLGFVVSDSEDEEALRLAYEMGQETAGTPPLALTLDNRPSNHSPGTVAGLAGTILLRATPARGQAKAPLEGAFGLFQQAMPPLILSGKSPREIARCTLELVMTAWARGRNGKPRKRLGGRTPAQVYAEARPTQEDIREALDWFQELARRQDRARLTREARRDPVRIGLLTRGLAELGIPDPGQRLATDLAIYAREAIARGLATFRAKQDRGTLPPDADPGRYLGGIIRHLHTRLELETTSRHLLAQRIRLGDLTLEPLKRAAERLRDETPLAERPQAFLDCALQAVYAIDFNFWGEAAADALKALPASQRSDLYPHLCRQAASTFKADRERRADLIDRMAEVVASVGLGNLD